LKPEARAAGLRSKLNTGFECGRPAAPDDSDFDGLFGDGPAARARARTAAAAAAHRTLSTGRQWQQQPAPSQPCAPAADAARVVGSPCRAFPSRRLSWPGSLAATGRLGGAAAVVGSALLAALGVAALLVTVTVLVVVTMPRLSLAVRVSGPVCGPVAAGVIWVLGLAAIAGAGSACLRRADPGRHRVTGPVGKPALQGPCEMQIL
jgi:hypothetical protein